MTILDIFNKNNFKPTLVVITDYAKDIIYHQNNTIIQLEEIYDADNHNLTKLNPRSLVTVLYSLPKEYQSFNQNKLLHSKESQNYFKIAGNTPAFRIQAFVDFFTPLNTILLNNPNFLNLNNKHLV